jgi:proteasome lid subunit RPN8/RPN11
MHLPEDPSATPDPNAGSQAGAVAPERTREPLLLPRTVLSEVYEHARESYPEECCGILTGPVGSLPNRVVRFVNLQNQRRAEGHSALDSTQAFWMDETELSRTIRELESRGQGIHAVYHSHIDAGAYLSAEDIRAALGPDGIPLWPGIGHLIVSVQGGTVREAAYFEWNAGQSSFVGRPVREAP